MAKPIIHQINPFDAESDYTFTFSWSGSRAYQNRLIIYSAETLSIVYDKIISSFVLSHTLPAYTLSNGIKYVAQCQMIDGSGNASALSDKVFFYTLETATFQFTGLPDGNKINNASYMANVRYQQANYEMMRSCRFYLYDAFKTVLIESEELYDQSDISYTYRGLETNAIYFIRCVGITVNGMELDTGYTEIYVSYKNPSDYAAIYAENVPNKGYIKYNTNIVIIQYNGTDSFEYDNGKIILSDGQVLYYDKGFNISGDFTLKIRGTNLYQTADILEAHNKDGYGFKISSYLYDDGLRFKLTAPNGLCDYIIYSDLLNFEDDNMVTITIRRKNNIYQIYTFMEVGGNEYPANYYFGDNMPYNASLYDIWIENGEAETIKVNHEDMVIFDQEEEPTGAIENNIWIGGA